MSKFKKVSEHFRAGTPVQLVKEGLDVNILKTSRPNCECVAIPLKAALERHDYMI